MTAIPKTIDIEHSPILSSSRDSATSPTHAVNRLEPKLVRARELMAKGDYQAALNALPAVHRDLETRNIYAVCMMRMSRFQEAIDLLRQATVDPTLNRMRTDVPDHIRINFATALFFGGRPSGGLEALAEINRDDDPAVILVRECARKWISSLGFIRRLDWHLNGIAPKQLPLPPDTPLGRCLWDIS